MPLREPFEEKYQILEKIGQGGMGAVYKVRHRLLDEPRVIKVIRSPLEPTPEAEERFLREARTACRLRHPNVALLHDFALGDDGRAYIVLEHIEGATLREFLRNFGPPPLSLALEIARQTALALQYLHRQRIVHRDVSPGNLMLTRDFEGRPLVKLIDLGLARSLENGSDSLTRGVFVGKVRYAAPEQFDEGPVDERSDLYSLGVVLYELLTGRCPIAGHDPKTWMAAHLFRPPLEFAESDPEGLVPEDLRALALRLLAKNPEARVPSAGELAQELREIQARFPLQGDELEDVFSGAAKAAPSVAPVPMAGAEALEEPVEAAEPVVLDEDVEPSLVVPPPLPEDSSISLLLRRPVRPVEDESVSIPLGFGAEDDRADDPSWDAPAARPRNGEGGLLYEPMEKGGALPASRPVPVRRSGVLLPVSLGVFSLAIIFTLVALYSVTSEFRLRREDSQADEEVTEPVAPPAEDAKAPATPATPEKVVEAQPVNVAPPMATAEPPLVEEVTGGGEPAPVAAAEPPARTAPKPSPRREKPAPQPRQAVAPPQIAQTPPRREPVVREGGIRPGPGVVPPIPLDLPRYSYPAAARGQGLDVDVRLDLLVDEKGKVIEAVVREGDASGLGFNETALAAARRLTFQPATRGEEPVKMWTEMIFEFSDPAARRSGR